MLDVARGGDLGLRDLLGGELDVLEPLRDVGLLLDPVFLLPGHLQELLLEPLGSLSVRVKGTYGVQGPVTTPVGIFGNSARTRQRQE